MGFVECIVRYADAVRGVRERTGMVSDSARRLLEMVERVRRCNEASPDGNSFGYRMWGKSENDEAMT
jgi:hypothetical protein